MISNNTASIPIRVFKEVKDLLLPFLKPFAVLCLVLCCFKSAEGTHSRLAAAILFGATALAILAFTLAEKFLKKKTAHYPSKGIIADKLHLGELVPLIIMVLIVALPFYILVITAIKTPLEATSLEFSWWPKEGIDLSSFEEVLSYGSLIGVSMGRALLNSFLYALIPTVISVFCSALSAYAFAKLDFPNKKRIYRLLILTIMMPACVTMTTSYIMYSWYGWTNTILPIVVPGAFASAATVMFLREFFMGIPNEMIEAARIDGAGKWRIFVSVILPLGKPAIIAQLILNFITKFNDFLTPLIYLNDPEEGPVLVDYFTDGAFYGYIPFDSEHFYLNKRLYCFGTRLGYKEFYIGEDGMPVAYDEEYTLRVIDYDKTFDSSYGFNTEDYSEGMYLTAKEDIKGEYFESLRERQNVTEYVIPKGTKLKPYLSDGKNYMVFELSDGGFVTLKYDDPDDYPKTINGIDESELLDGILYAG